jgi:hypothetical protein
LLDKPNIPKKKKKSALNEQEHMEAKAIEWLVVNVYQIAEESKRISEKGGNTSEIINKFMKKLEEVAEIKDNKWVVYKKKLAEVTNYVEDTELFLCKAIMVRFAAYAPMSCTTSTNMVEKRKMKVEAKR